MHVLYRSEDKWKGPCAWPTFRAPLNDNSISISFVENYNNYKCAVAEVYCSHCDLFIGHQFEDGKEKGDNHENARWRH